MGFFKRAWRAAAGVARTIWERAIVPAARWGWDRVIRPAFEMAAPIAAELLGSALIDMLRRGLSPRGDDGFASAPN